MSRRKRSSPALLRARDRAAGLASIDPTLDLGNDHTLAGYQAKIDATQLLLNDYNTAVAALDGRLNELEESEAKLAAETTAMLSAVAVKFGKDSTEYEKAGGTRTSEQKRRKPAGSEPTPTATP